MEMPLFCCPHDTISGVFYDDMLLPDWTRSCNSCDFSVVNIIAVENVTAVENANERHYTLQTTRNLGKARELADKTWYRQCDSRYRMYEEERLEEENQAKVADVAN